MKPKNLALLAAGCAYVGMGYTSFALVSVLTGDTDSANWIVAALSLPLMAPLFYAIGWIERRL